MACVLLLHSGCVHSSCPVVHVLQSAKQFRVNTFNSIQVSLYTWQISGCQDVQTPLLISVCVNADSALLDSLLSFPSVWIPTLLILLDLPFCQSSVLFTYNTCATATGQIHTDLLMFLVLLICFVSMLMNLLDAQSSHRIIQRKELNVFETDVDV